MAEIVLTAAVEGASLLSETVTDIIAPAVVEAAGACADRIRENPMAASLSVSAALHAAKKLKGTVFTHNKIDESYQNAAFKTGKYTHEHRLANIEKHLALAQQREAKMMIVQMNGFKNGTAWLDNIDKFHTPGICQYCSKCKKRLATHGKEDAEKPELCQICVEKKRNGDEFVKDFREQTVDYLYNNVVAFHRDSENHKAQLQILDPETETRISIRTATVVSDLAAANKTLVEHVTKQDSRNEDGIAENRKMAMLMLQQLADQSTFQNKMMERADEQHFIAQEAQIKAAEQTNNILLEVMKQNKNVSDFGQAIGKLTDMNIEATKQLRIVEEKVITAQTCAHVASVKAGVAQKEAVEAKDLARKYKVERETALNKIREMDIIYNPEETMATALESKIVDNPDRFRGKAGAQGEAGARGAAGQSGAQGARGPGFWSNPFAA